MATRTREAGVMILRQAVPPEVERRKKKHTSKIKLGTFSVFAKMPRRTQVGAPLFEMIDVGSNGAIKDVTIGGSDAISNAAVDAEAGRGRKVCFRLAPTKLAVPRRRNSTQLGAHAHPEYISEG